ncbi:MAG: hypothetical protein U1E65_07720 [Myxococcota bacterium]
MADAPNIEAVTGLLARPDVIPIVLMIGILGVFSLLSLRARR